MDPGWPFDRAARGRRVRPTPATVAPARACKPGAGKSGSLRKRSSQMLQQDALELDDGRIVMELERDGAALEPPFADAVNEF